MMRGLTFSSIASALVFAARGLIPINFSIDPRRAIGERRVHGRRARNRYSGAALREIRRSGQHGECARRRRQMGATP